MSIYHICTECAFSRDLRFNMTRQPCPARESPYDPLCVKNEQFLIQQKQRSIGGYYHAK